MKHSQVNQKVWMEEHKIDLLSRPEQSPDLNLIGNLWNVIKRRIDGHKRSDETEVIEFLPP